MAYRAPPKVLFLKVLPLAVKISRLFPSVPAVRPGMLQSMVISVSIAKSGLILLHQS